MGQKGFYLIGAVLAIFMISSVMNSLLDRAALLISAETLSKIRQREIRNSKLWQFIDYLGGAMIIFGICKAIGLLPLKNSGNWGIPTMALGLLAICTASSLRAWTIGLAYSAEAPGTPAQRSAMTAAWVTTLVELLFGAAVCIWIFNPQFTQAVSNGATPTEIVERVHRNDALPVAEKMWITESEALKLLPGKDAKYLKRLVENDEIKSKQDDRGEVVYNRNHIVKTIEAGLPIYTDDPEKRKEDVKPVVEKNVNTPEALPEKKQPATQAVKEE